MVQIKEFSLTYLNDAVELIHSNIRNVFPMVYTNEVVEYYLRYHSASNIRKNATIGQTYLGFVNSKLAGTVNLSPLYIQSLYVHTDYQNQGIGTTLLGFALIQARKMSLKHVKVDATPNAKAFYMKKGFTLVKDTEMLVENKYRLPYSEMLYTLQ